MLLGIRTGPRLNDLCIPGFVGAFVVWVGGSIWSGANGNFISGALLVSVTLAVVIMTVGRLLSVPLKTDNGPARPEGRPGS